MLAILFPSIDPILLSIGPINIRWYGIAYGVGIIIGYALMKVLNNKNEKNKFSSKFFDDFFIYITLGILLGGRLGYVIFYNTDLFFISPLSILKTWDGGMSFHGGLLGVLTAIYLLCKKHKEEFLRVSDMLACVVPIGIFFGRIANFINAELYGRITDASWAVIFPGEYFARHPSQLYEAFSEGVLLFCILFSIYTLTNIKNKVGVISGLFLIFYSISRFLVEYFREPDSHIGFIIYNYTMGQILTLPMLLVGLTLIYLSLKKSVKKLTC